jgi:hypothetical protein
MTKLRNLQGEKFGRLTPIEILPERVQGRVAWLCECECGARLSVESVRLTSGNTKSCGCYRVDRGVTHGKSTRTHGAWSGNRPTPEWTAWSQMRYRCERPTHAQWLDYGGRGIAVCQRWRDSFEAFLSDMGPRPTPRHSIDRIDNDRGYAPGNCRWATASEQNKNRRERQPVIVSVTIDGETLSLDLALARYGVHRRTFYARVRAGSTIAEALTRGPSRK